MNRNNIYPIVQVMLASILFGTAPLAGIGLSFLLLQEPVNDIFWMAFPLMIIGATLLMYEDHSHQHIHETIVHNHWHRHDDGHHNHAHEAIDLAQAYSHSHEHASHEHNHRHMQDIHHRYVHT